MRATRLSKGEAFPVGCAPTGAEHPKNPARTTRRVSKVITWIRMQKADADQRFVATDLLRHKALLHEKARPALASVELCWNGEGLRRVHNEQSEVAYIRRPAVDELHDSIGTMPR